MTDFTTKKTARWILGIIVVALAIYILATNSGVHAILKVMIMPLIYAICVAYVLDAIARAFNKRLKMSRGKSILCAYLIMLFLIVLAIIILVPLLFQSITSIVNILPSTEAEWKGIADDFMKMFNATSLQFPENIVTEVTAYLQSVSKEIVSYIGKLFSGIQSAILNALVVTASGIFTAITAIILSIYMLIDKEDLLARMKRLVKAIFNKSTSDYLLRHGKNANETFIAFFIGKMIDSAFVAVIAVIAFTIFGIPYAPLMGVILGVFNMIPYFGPIFATVPIVIVSTIAGGWVTGLISLAIILIIQQFDANFMDPKIVGEHVGTRPFWIIFAVTAGGAAFGAVGMILAVPIMIVVKEAVEEFVDLKLDEKGEADYLLNEVKDTPRKGREARHQSKKKK